MLTARVVVDTQNYAPTIHGIGAEIWPDNSYVGFAPIQVEPVNGSDRRVATSSAGSRKVKLTTYYRDSSVRVRSCQLARVNTAAL